MTTLDLLVEQICDPKIILRPVRMDTVQYAELRDSIEDFGVLSSVTVRPVEDDLYELVAGFHRLTISRELQIRTIPATVKPLTDRQALSVQLQENVCRADTTRTDIARQLIRIQKTQPGITIAALARLANKSTKWVKAQMLLLELNEGIQQQVDRGEIPVMNAYELTRLPTKLQEEFASHAMLMGREEFRTLVTEKIVELQQDSRRQAYTPPKEFQPHPYMRGLKEILRDQGKARDEGLGTWDAAIMWVLHLDPHTVAKRREEYEARTQHQIRREAS